jgi:hypothetical protein
MEVQVEVFPAYSFQGTVNLNLFRDVANAINEGLKTTLRRGLGGTVTIEPQVILPAGQLQVSAGWKEARDWRAFYGWEVQAGLEPLVGISLQIRPNFLAIAGTAVGIPPQLTDLAGSLFLHLQIGGSIGLSGRGARTAPDAYAIGVRGNGQIWIEVGIGGRAGNEDFISAEIVGSSRTGVTLSANVDYTTGERGGITFNPKLEWNGLTVTVRVITSAAGVEMTNNELITWTVFDPCTIYEPEQPFVLIGNN